MTSKAKRKYESMCEYFDQDILDNPAFDDMLKQYAGMVIEANDLQTFIDKEGHAYLHTSDKGNQMWKVYPQSLALGKLRGQMNVVLKTLLKYSIDGEEVDADENLIA